jgi:hypothetical protein
VLSVLDDFSRYVLATIVAFVENIAAAVRVIRLAISKWGISERMQCDRGSAFDSIDFRTGLALLGVHRNWVQSRTPEAQAKVEAYHRVLQRWFIRELRHQEVQNLEHLEALLQATIDLFYNQHRHRELRMSPAEALAGRISPRRVSAEDLARAFWATTEAKSHPKTGQLVLPNGAFRVPLRYAGKRLSFLYDPVEEGRAALLIGRDRELALEPFVKKRPFPKAQDTPPPRGTGQLQKLLDVWRGASRPNAQPGFGLPELFRELSHLLGHLPPQDDREAQTILGFYRRFGPLHPDHLRDALAKTQATLGPGRALETYLDHLARLIAAHTPKEKQS